MCEIDTCCSCFSSWISSSVFLQEKPTSTSVLPGKKPQKRLGTFHEDVFDKILTWQDFLKFSHVFTSDLMLFCIAASGFMLKRWYAVCVNVVRSSYTSGCQGFI